MILSIGDRKSRLSGFVSIASEKFQSAHKESLKLSCRLPQSCVCTGALVILFIKIAR